MRTRETRREGAASPPQALWIFLSSTAEDLGAHRAKVTTALEELGQRAVRMEIFGARDGAPLEECQKLARGADALVVCVAYRYGWVPSQEEGGDGKKSITWYEVEAALDAGRPVFAFPRHWLRRNGLFGIHVTGRLTPRCSGQHRRQAPVLSADLIRR